MSIFTKRLAHVVGYVVGDVILYNPEFVFIPAVYRLQQAPQ